jgi:hypothetical protein
VATLAIRAVCFFFGTLVSTVTDTTPVYAALNYVLELADGHTQKVIPFPMKEIETILYTRFVLYLNPAALNETHP